MSETIHGQKHGGNQHYWHGGEAAGKVPGGPNAAKLNNAVAQPHAKDSVDSAHAANIIEHIKETQIKALGAGNARLSSLELNRLDPKDPKIPGTDDHLSGPPPTGPAGTGNPFFAPNPMVAFFRSFFNVIQLMKWNNAVATKLAMQELSLIQEMGKSQANAIIQAGKAQYDAEMAQAITAGIQAGIGAASMAMSGLCWMRASSAVSKEADAVGDALKKSENAVEETGQKMNKGLDKARARAQRINEIEGELHQNQVDLVRQKGAGTTVVEREGRVRSGAKAPRPDSTAVEANKQAQNNMVKRSVEDKFDATPVDDTPPPQPKRESIDTNESFMKKEEEYNALKKEHDVRVQARKAQDAEYQNLFGNSNRDSLKNRSTQELQNEMDQLKSQNVRAEKEFNSNKKKLDQQKENLAHLERDSNIKKASRAASLQTLMHNDPLFTLSQSAQSVATSSCQFAQHYYAAKGHLEAARWNAFEKYLEMGMQIGMKSLEMDFEMRREADSHVDKICEALTGLSNTEQAGMRWAA